MGVLSLLFPAKMHTIGETITANTSAPVITALIFLVVGAILLDGLSGFAEVATGAREDPLILEEKPRQAFQSLSSPFQWTRGQLPEGPAACNGQGLRGVHLVKATDAVRGQRAASNALVAMPFPRFLDHPLSQSGWVSRLP